MNQRAVCTVNGLLVLPKFTALDSFQQLSSLFWFTGIYGRLPKVVKLNVCFLAPNSTCYE